MRSRRTLPASLAGLVALTLAAGCGGAQDVATSDSTSTPTGAPDTVTSVPTTAASTTVPPTSGSPSTEGSGDLPAGFGDGPPGSGIERFYDQQVTWDSCGGGDECADIWVPLDYADPDGQAITVKAKRDPADDQSARRGSLFINPGGPGGSGIDYLSYIALAPSVTAAYDVIGFDPRGVASSTPVECLSDSQLDDYIASDPSPDDAAEVQDFEDSWTAFTQGCEDHSGPLLAHVSTVEVAEDMDVMRQVVGDDKLNYFGASYGTYVGATYAGLFPDKVDRMVLDGAVDPLAKPRTSEIDQAAGFDDSLTDYLQDCVDQGGCPLGDSVDAARQQIIQLLADIDQSPLPTTSGREVTEGLAFYGIVLPLYSKANWPYLTQALEQALSGSGDTLLLLADSYSGRTQDGTYPDNSLEVQSAVNCLDKPESESVNDIEADGKTFLDKAPVFGSAAMWWPYACSNWPVKSTTKQPDFSAKGAAPIVVVGTTRDPATPYQQAVNLAHELDSGVLLSRDGDGHTAYGMGNDCIDDAINTYLVTGEPPRDGTQC